MIAVAAIASREDIDVPVENVSKCRRCRETICHLSLIRAAHTQCRLLEPRKLCSRIDIQTQPYL